MKFLDTTGLSTLWGKIKAADEAVKSSLTETLTIGDREVKSYLGGLLVDLGTFDSAGTAETFAKRADICGTYTFIVFRMENSNNVKTAFMLNLLYNSAASAYQYYYLGKDKYYRAVSGIQDALTNSDPTATTASSWTDGSVTAQTTTDIDEIFTA